MENDTGPGDEGLSIEQAAAAYTASLAKEPDKGQPTATEEDTSAHDADEFDESADAGEADDGDTEDEGQAEDEADAEQASDQGRFVANNGKVKLPDGSVSTVAELIQGNLRDRDYRQKTMKLAEDGKSFTAQSAAVKERETQLEQQSKYVADLIRSIVPAEPELGMLETDPIAYWKAKGSRDQWIAHLQYLDGEAAKSAKAKADAASTAEKETAEKEWAALLEKVPSLKDENKVKAFGDDLKKYGAEYGFTPDEIRRAVFSDHRQALVLRKAIAWDRLQASKANVAKKVDGRPPVQKGGVRQTSGQRQAKAASDALANLGKTGRLDDAVSAYLALQK
jgi:hypothetical protein